MRDIEQQRLALECLKIAGGDVSYAADMLAFVTGAKPTPSATLRQIAADLEGTLRSAEAP